MRLFCSLLLLGFLSNSAWSDPQYNLQDLIDIAKRENPILKAKPSSFTPNLKIELSLFANILVHVAVANGRI